MTREDLDAILEGIAPALKTLRDELDATKADLATARAEIEEIKARPAPDIAGEVALALEQRAAVADFVKSLETSIAAELGAHDVA